MDSIPIEAIAEARNALADQYIILKTNLEKPSVIAFFHRRRTEVRVLKMEQFLSELDAWLKEVTG